MKRSFFGLTVFTLGLLLQVSTVVAQQPRNRGAQRQPAPVSDLKIKYKTTTAGQSSESVTMIKGARERSEMRMGYGMDTVNITQCDLKRTIQWSDKTRKYLVTPMVTPRPHAPHGQTPDQPRR